MLHHLVAVGLALSAMTPFTSAEEQETTQQTSDRAQEDNATESGATRRIGGPDQVDNTIADDDASISRVFERRLYEPYFGWKKRLKEKTGLGFGIDYSTAYLAASDSPADAEDRAGSGMVRFFGSWDLVGRESGNTGAFIWKIEHRHEYTEIPASAFGFNLGYAGLLEPPFSDQGFRVTNLYWRQRFAKGRATVFAGFVDATDYLVCTREPLDRLSKLRLQYGNAHDTGAE